MKKLLLIFTLLVLPVVSIAPAFAQFDVLDSTCFQRDEDGKFITEDGKDDGKKKLKENLAESSVCQEAIDQQENKKNPLTDKDGTLTRVAELISVITAAIAVIIIVIAGITMVLSSGDSTKVQNSRNAIIYAAVGLVVVALARSIITLVINRI